MGFREKFYSKYVSTHTANLYGDRCLDNIKKQFSVWKWYYGRVLSANHEDKILEIGCGDGGFVYWLQQIGYKNASGIDISKEQVELACEMGIENVTCGDLKGFLDGKQGEYDLIFARDVLEHFNKEEILEILETIYIALKDNGKFVIQVPNAEGPFGSRYRYWDMTHEIAFTRSSISQLFQLIGFRKVECYPTGPVPKGVKSFVRYVLWKFIELIFSFYMLVEIGTKEGIFTQNIIGVGIKQIKE